MEEKSENNGSGMDHEQKQNALSDRYSPNEVETKIYSWWKSNGYFRAQDRSTKPPYSIILPPPNVTGSLHMGHALDHTIQDVLIRWKRMMGFNALWLPGTDHAGIATQSVVERELKKEGKNRREMGREAFVEKVWEWKRQYGNRIYEQMERMGDSCDWDRATFTLDEGVSVAVRKVFVELYKKGLIYKGTKLINWSWPLETAISDLEVEHRETKGTLYYIDYPIEGKDVKLTVATTRPETLLGDSALCVHPADERYIHLIGSHAILPLLGRKIPVIGDDYVEREFGSGVLKITPAHDFNDYQIGVRHKLPFHNILEKNGSLNAEAGPYKGLKINEARKKVVEDLKTQGFLQKEEVYKHSVGYCSRSGAVVEPLLSEQWFLRMKHLSVPARNVVESGTVQFEPESWTKTYLHWLSIIEDWCISRQLWWGHRIPAWQGPDGKIFVAENIESARAEADKFYGKVGTELKQDEDVLDTWFSSALWPFSTMGWPKDSEAQSTFYPTNILVTGHDIIFFWVARMIVMGLEFKKDVPFRKVYIHGLIRDADGKKMSKSSGNAADPVLLIEKHGADALRFTLMSQIASGRDLKFSETRLEGYRNFMNKIWNATRFSLTALADFQTPAEQTRAIVSPSDLSVADQWLIYTTGQVYQKVEEALDEERFSDAANALYHFVWNDFCDWYLEFVKPTIYGNPSAERSAAQLVLAQTLNRCMRLLHPFVPFITEEIYAKLPIKSEALIIAPYPTVLNDREWLSLGKADAAFEMKIVQETITAIRNIRGENLIKPGVSIKARLAPSDARTQKILGENKAVIMRLAKLEQCEIGAAGSLQKCAVTPVRLNDASVDVIVPLEGVVDLAEEVKRLHRVLEKLEKECQVMTSKLENENYLKNAPEEIVQADKEILLQNKDRVARLRESLQRLQ